MVAEAQGVQDFLADSASQLTPHGLMELHAGLKENEVAVLFRNNHFSTIFKRAGKLYVLVTDQGYVTEHKVIWEELSDVGGNTAFVDGAFQSAQASTTQYTVEQAFNEDAAAQAAQLLSTAGGEGAGGPAGTGGAGGDGGPPYGDYLPTGLTAQQQADADYALALSLQEEINVQAENEAAAARRQQEQAANPAPGRPAAEAPPPPPGGARRRDPTLRRPGRGGAAGESGKAGGSCAVM